MTAPQLSKRDIERELDRIFKAEHKALLVALYGTGEACRLRARDHDWEIIPTRSELDLRVKMPLPEQTPKMLDTLAKGKAFLIDWTEEPLPLDLSCRLTGKKVLHISGETRLSSLFGARTSEPGIVRTAVARLFLNGAFDEVKKVSGVKLTRNELMRHFLHAWIGFPLRKELNAASLTLWLLASSDAVAERSKHSELWQKATNELASYLEVQAGPLSRLVWNAWQQGQVRRMLQVAVLVDAHKRKGDPVAEGLLQGRLAELSPGYGDVMLSEREALPIEGFLNDVLAHEQRDTVKKLLAEAEKLISFSSFKDTLVKSPWLRAGYVQREQELAQALTKLVNKPDFRRWEQVRQANIELDTHQQDKLVYAEHQVKTRTFVMRLAAWLVLREQQPKPGIEASYRPAIDLAKQYAKDGGLLDWCRGRVRSSLQFIKLNRALMKLLTAVDERRREDDERFSKALIQWHELDKPAKEVIPIEQVLRRMVADLLNENNERRVLVVVMDGMSWATAVQLLTYLEENNRWEPIVWRPKGSKDNTQPPPVFAALPTLTSVSRAALFEGKVDLEAGDKPSQLDTKRWASNHVLFKANEEKALPDLVLRAKLMDSRSPEISTDLNKTIQSKSRVVGVVVNAIDENLHGSSQTYLDYSETIIKPLNGLLTAADGADRVVLLCSDHGHELGDAMTPHRQPMPPSDKQQQGRRWRSLATGQELFAFERELPNGTWRPEGTQRVAAIWDPSVCHSRANYGEHGGISLAEVVTPALLLAPWWLAEAKNDEQLQTRPFPKPRWWDLELQVPQPDEDGHEKQTQKSQLTLPIETKRDQLEKIGPGALAHALSKSRIFKENAGHAGAKNIKAVLALVDILDRAGGKLSELQVARQMGKNPRHVRGLVLHAQTILTIDGYGMIKHDRAAKQVILLTDRLKSQYELSL